MPRKTSVVAIMVGLMMAAPTIGWSQSARNGTIGGSVKDTTGALLPGVTVEATSPALIEKVRTVVTDQRGEYKIIDVPPGTYSVTFTLPGFSTVKHEGIELTTGFTAAVNGELKVGSVEETITVTGATPIVDVQNARTQQVLKAETMDDLPSGIKDLTQYASLILGATNGQAGRNDVGGDKGEQNTGIVIHGGRAEDGRVNYDGMSTNVFSGAAGGQHRIYHFNMVGVAEVVVDTGGNAAESETGGGNLNVVPKDGGNTFKVYAIGSFTNHGLTSGKVPDSLIARGSAPDQKSVKRVYDSGIGVGGPVVKDRLWFYSANRWWGSQNPIANNYFNKTIGTLFYTPDLSQPAYVDQPFKDYGGRLTWQAAAKHKVTVSENYQLDCFCYSFSGGTRFAPEATQSYIYGPMWMTQATWNYTPTNRLLVQGGVSLLHQLESFLSYPDPSRRSETPLDAISVLELSTGYAYGMVPSTSIIRDENEDNFQERLSMSYITGSHAVKVGLQTYQARIDAVGEPTQQITYTFRNQVPISLTQIAGPLVQAVRARGLGLFVQDQWTIKRLTLNYGARLDRYWTYAPAVTKPEGPYVGALSFPKADLADMKDIAPRIGGSYDLFGNGKTAIKATWGRYLMGQGLGTTLTYSPARALSTSATRVWNDANGNYVPDCVLTDAAANGECQALNNRFFGQSVTNSRWDEDARAGWGVREYNYQITAQLQHELRPGFGVQAGYFRTWWRNQTAVVNTAVSASDFTAYCVTGPVDPRLDQFSGHEVCGNYDVNPSKFGQVFNVLTRASNFGTPEEIFNGIDLGFNTRFRKGALLQGGVTLGRTATDICYANSLPNVLPTLQAVNQPRTSEYCHVVSSWWSGVGSQVKLQAIYPLPWDLQLSGTYKNLPGVPLTADMVVTNSQVAPALGRNLAACPASGTCTAAVTVPVIAIGPGTVQLARTGTVFDDRLNQVDLRLAKTFRVGPARVQANMELYNAFNTRNAQAIVTTYGATWLQPAAILGGRLVKFGGQFDF